MVARNDITGDKIKTKAGISEEYMNNFDHIFGKKLKDSPDIEHKTIDEEVEIKRSIGDTVK